MINQTVDRQTAISSHISNAHGMKGRLSNTTSGSGG